MTYMHANLLTSVMESPIVGTFIVCFSNTGNVADTKEREFVVENIRKVDDGWRAALDIGVVDNAIRNTLRPTAVIIFRELTYDIIIFVWSNNIGVEQAYEYAYAYGVRRTA
jgi:hypothetical protein